MECLGKGKTVSIEIWNAKKKEWQSILCYGVSKKMNDSKIYTMECWSKCMTLELCYGVFCKMNNSKYWNI